MLRSILIFVGVFNFGHLVHLFIWFFVSDDCLINIGDNLRRARIFLLNGSTLLKASADCFMGSVGSIILDLVLTYLRLHYDVKSQSSAVVVELFEFNM